ncbi:MAG TPA: azurin [Steroidobacteraceae bacterium]|nr:azurin [Steroidobacteraceae bacterium]
MKLIPNTLAALVVLASPALLLMSAPAAAAGDACKVEITGNDQMQYDKKEIDVPASCKEVTVTLHHSGQLPAAAMGHNWVLVNTPDLTAVANAGMGAGLASDYVPAGDKRVLAHTKVVGGGQTTSVTFSTAALKAGGDYSYLCTFPGHNALMRGKFKFG